MRFATTVREGAAAVGIVRAEQVLPLGLPGADLGSVRAIAASGPDALRRVRDWVDAQPEDAYRPIHEVELGPAVADPGAIYTIGLNYRAPGVLDDAAPERPLVYGKAPSSVAGHGSVVDWDRSVTANVDAEIELGVVIGEPAWRVEAEHAMRHVFGYTCINDISSRDPWLDGDQWLIGKSMPGFCPVGPWVVTRDELDPMDLGLGCRINGLAIQEDRTASMRFAIPDLIAYLSRHVELRPGDLIATGTPARLPAPPGPERRLEPGDVVTAWIEGIGELTNSIA